MESVKKEKIELKCSLVYKIVMVADYTVREFVQFIFETKRVNERGLTEGMSLSSVFVFISSRRLAEILKQDLIRFISVRWKVIIFSRIHFKNKLFNINSKWDEWKAKENRDKIR